MSSPAQPNGFAPNWRAEVLNAPPLIAPARQFVYPHNIPGEEDALARGALQALVHPQRGGVFLATFALGFNAPNLPRAVLPCPNPDELCAVAGGYAYLIDANEPTRFTLLDMRPVVEILPAPDYGLLVFVGHHHLAAWGHNGLAWQTARLSWEGVRITGIENGHITGFGWDLHTDREVPFAVNLATGAHSGGAFPAPKPKS